MAFILISWGGTGHYKISHDASLSFTEEMSEFNSWTNILADHASDADYRKSDDSDELAKHYINIDNYSDFISYGSIPESFEGAIDDYGAGFVYQNGILPWATLAVFDSLKKLYYKI